ncbi:hypothetical protein MCAP1_001627 [Malassezia caprae]|uniref:Pre-rRNA-processing protein RIX1 N-terminal domain-containing protein n=1 Tax=Malassezia caprae TaxID=1381934 RepID=A0AAF0EB31_9BASI|nr:hypothetical protein MCAP1_001627 [Malassezia caprae]
MPSPVLEPLLAALDADAHGEAALWRAEAEQVVRACILEGDQDGLHSLEKLIAQRLNTPVAHNEDASPPWNTAMRLMSLMLSQAGWKVAESFGATWIQRTHAHLDQAAQRLRTAGTLAALDPLAHLAAFVMTELLGRESIAHPEYHRVVAAPSISKYAHATLAVLELAAAQPLSPATVPAMSQLMDALSLHVELYANTYRTFTSRIHALCMQLLFGSLAPSDSAAAPLPELLARSAMALLASLHLTGAITSDASMLSSAASGKVSQAQLWAATVTEMLDAAMLSVCGSVPSMDWYALGIDPSLAQPRALAWEPPSADYDRGIPCSVRRCEHLLGSATSGAMGMVPLYLTMPTPRAVPVPLARCIALAHAMMQAHSSSSRATVDQMRLEASAAPKLRWLGVQLLVQIVIAFHEATWPLLHGSGVLRTVCMLAESERGPVRLVAMRALSVLLSRGACTERLPGASVPLDPASPLVQRIARASIQPLSELLVQEPVLWTEELPLKRPRSFESDTISQVDRVPQEAILVKTPLAWDLACAGALVLVQVFSYISTSAAPGHRDLARAGALSLLGTCEAVLGARLVDASSSKHVEAGAQLVQALAQLVVVHHNALVSHILARVYAVMARGAQSSTLILRAASQDALTGILTVIRPRAPPIVDAVESSALEERIDADGTDHIPMPLPGWRGPASALADVTHVDEVVPVQPPPVQPVPNELKTSAPSTEAPAEPARAAPATPAVAAPATLPDSAPMAPPAPIPVEVEQPRHVAPVSAPASSMPPPSTSAPIGESDDEALPDLHMEVSDDESVDA